MSDLVGNPADWFSHIAAHKLPGALGFAKLPVRIVATVWFDVLQITF